MTAPIDPNLEQDVRDDEAIVEGVQVAIAFGHVDLGPQMIDGELEFLARDDSGDPPVWRDPEDIIFEVSDAARLDVPSDYSFVGGDEAWVIPQTEVADVPWLGWNTQAPSIAAEEGSGVTLELLDHRGPGNHSLFLQSGGFSEPDVLWTGDEPGTIFAEMGTHTHANWVFTKPGSHELDIRATLEGTDHTADATLRFAVGIPAEEFSEPSDFDEAGFPYLIVGIVVLVVLVLVVWGWRKWA